MISGLNQELDILGKTFHFQTELSDQEGLSIRTEVFVGGKVVATRDMDLEPEDKGAGEEAIRALMKEQHNRTLTTFVARARRYQEQIGGTGGESAAATAPSPEKLIRGSLPPLKVPDLPARSAAGTSAELPASIAQLRAAPPISEAAAVALEVRRCFARFRRLIDLAGTITTDVGERLERAAKGFVWMVESPTFNEIRVDEQVRCHLVKEQIDDWLAGERSPAAGAGVWDEIKTYSTYLGGVNRRCALQEIDQQFLLWALDEVQTHGMKEEIRRPLSAAVYGRDGKLDRMLDEPEEITDRTWIAHLRRVLLLI